MFQYLFRNTFILYSLYFDYLYIEKIVIEWEGKDYILMPTKYIWDERLRTFVTVKWILMWPRVLERFGVVIQGAILCLLILLLCQSKVFVFLFILHPGLSFLSLLSFQFLPLTEPLSVPSSQSTWTPLQFKIEQVSHRYQQNTAYQVQ